MMLRGCMLVIASIFFIRAYAQVDMRKVDKQVKDPATKERAAKADRHVSKDRSIYDTSVVAGKEKRQKKARKKGSRG
jgi:hypothetical protein